MFHIPLSTDETRLIVSAPGAVYQAARWIKQFHQASYTHIGWLDHPEGMAVAEVLNKYGFLRTPRFEFNAVRELLQTYGPLLISGAFAHLAGHETVLPVAEMTVVRVSSYEDRDHAVIVNGYWDGFAPRLLYRDPSHAARQFAVELSRLKDRLDLSAGVHYLNCASFPKPCAHMPKPAVTKLAANRQSAESQA